MDIIHFGDGSPDAEICNGRRMSSLEHVWVIKCSAIDKLRYVNKQRGADMYWHPTICNLETKSFSCRFSAYLVSSHDGKDGQDAIWKDIPRVVFYPEFGVHFPKVGRVWIEPLSGFDVL
jgi:hypothetical protein